MATLVMSTSCKDQIAPTSLNLSDGFQIGGFKFRQISGGIDLSQYLRLHSGGGDRFALYQKTHTDGGRVVYTSRWKPGSISDMQFLRHYYTDEQDVSNTWWRIRPAADTSPHNRIPAQWSAFDGGSKTAIPGFCIFQADTDEIYRKLPVIEISNATSGILDPDYDQIHLTYQVNTTAGSDPLVGFKSQYDATGIISQTHTFQYTLSTNFFLQPKFKVFIPPGVSLMKLQFQSEPGTTLELKTCFGKSPQDLTAQTEPNSSAHILYELLDRQTPLQPEETAQIISGHSNYQETYSVYPLDDPSKTIAWFKPESATYTPDWFYCASTGIDEPSQILSARISYLITDLVSYRAWYDTTNWDVIGDPEIEEELTTNTLSGSGRDREIRGNHEIATLQGWDGKTYINLKQPTDPLNVRLTAIARSSGIYGTQFYDFSTQDAKNSLAFKTTLGNKPSSFKPTFYTETQRADFWDQTKIPDQLKQLPVLVCYNEVSNTVRYFVMVAYILTNTDEQSQTPTIYGGMEKQTQPIISNGDWVTPPPTQTTIPSLQPTKSELMPIILHFFMEITEAEFNSHKFVSTSLPY